MSDPTSILIRHLVFPLWSWKNGSRRLAIARDLRRSQYWTRQRLLEEQLTRCRKLISHAYATCEFYRRKYERAGIHPESIRTLADVANLPTISKEEIQEHSETMISALYDRRRLRRDMTGGSTGSPLVFYYDDTRHDSREAASIRHDEWAGWSIGAKKAVLWGAPQDTAISRSVGSRLREGLIERRLILDAANLNDQSLQWFQQCLQEYQPTVIQAYAGTLALFAKYLDGKPAHGIAPKGIITSAEVLTDTDRALIERVFQSPVHNRYGCREFGVIASECEVHDGMHVNAENLLVEVSESNGQQSGEILVTDLRNFAMPMIRYRIRDIGRLIERDCPCGRGLPLLSLEGGRTSDFLTATDGRKVSGIVIATYVITNISGIQQVQFLQHTTNRVVVRLVKNAAWTPTSMRQLEKQARAYLGSDMILEPQFVDIIAREKSGKFRFTISTL